MKFENPWYFLLLLLFPLFMRKKPSFVYFPFMPFLKTVPVTLRVILQKVVPWLGYIALFLIVVALARPQKIDEKTKKYSEGIDIMLLLDISDSMRSEDFKPDNRLVVAKKVIRDFVKDRENDRIGLIVFSGESYTLSPLTIDHDVILKRIDDIEINKGDIKQGTAIGMAIANGVARLKDSNARTRIMVLVTDGDNNTGVIDPITASELSADNKIKIYSIGIGRDGKIPFPVYTNTFMGQRVKQYTYVMNKLNTEIFEKISKNTNGSFFRATDSGALARIFKKIDRLEKSKFIENKLVRVKDYFPEILKWSLGLFAAMLALWSFLFRRLPL
ncbi:MAG: VWA domain-containing protein [Oligoflexia bacterium]|nr:VWA domain-containing protein [Oligoflexia bacterium]